MYWTIDIMYLIKFENIFTNKKKFLSIIGTLILYKDK